MTASPQKASDCAEEAMKAMDDGTLDAQTAIGALTDYMHEFDGSMAKSKDNVIDAWGDVTGNLQTMCAEIGMGIFDAFNQSEIIQDLIQFTQDLVDMVRGEGCGAFSDLKEVASFALDIIDGALNIVITTFKFIILTLDSAIYDLVKSILSSIGKGFAGEVNKSWKQTFGKKTEIEPEDRASQNHFRTVKRSVKAPAAAKSGGGSRRSGGGSVKKELTEEEKAIEALIKKYSDADKQKWALAKSTVELAKVNMSMLTGEAKTQEEKRIKLLEIQNAHNQLLEGLNKELALAAKIGDETKRKSTLKSIQDQIDAENELYNAKVRAAEYSSNFANLQKQSQSILDQVFGNKDEAQQKIDELKQKLTQDLEEINAIMAQPTEAEQLTGFAALLGKTPEQFQADMEAQGTTFDAFVEKYKEGLAKAAEAEKNSITIAEQWKKKVCEYADQVGKSLGDAMADFILGEKGAKEALADFAKSIIQNAVRILAQWLGVFAIYSAFPMIASGMTPADAANKTVFGITKKATGGYITGPGTGTSDSIPAMLSNGEYVIRSAAVDAVGLSTLDAINAGRVPEFADGGSVDDTIAATTGGDSITLQVSAIDATSFAGFLDRGGLDKIKQALFEENRRFRSTSGVW